jgi:choline-sulfatase
LRPALTLRRGKYKYVYVRDTPAQLFDLEADPLEQHNLSGQPNLQTVETEMAALVPEAWQDGSLEQRILVDQRNRLWIKDAMRRAPYPSWDYQPVFDASKQYRRE